MGQKESREGERIRSFKKPALMIRLFLYLWLVFGAGLGAMMAEIAAEALLPSAKELKAEKLALVDQEIARGNRDWDKIQERVTNTMNQRYGKEMAMAKVIGTTAGALFFKRDGAEGAEQGAVRAVDYNTTGCLAALDYTDPSVVRYLESIPPETLLELGFTIASLTPGGKLLKGGKQALQVGSKVVKKVISRVVPKKALQKIAKPFSKPKIQKPVDYNKISTAKPNQSAKPRDLNEQLFWEQVKKNPEAGRPLPNCNNDPRFLKADGWQKMEVIYELNNGKKMSLHYQYNNLTNTIADMKFDLPKNLLPQ